MSLCCSVSDVEKLIPGEPITMITEIDRAVIKDHVFLVYNTGNGQLRKSGYYLHERVEGTRWARGHSGPAVDALLAAEALR